MSKSRWMAGVLADAAKYENQAMPWSRVNRPIRSADVPVGTHPARGGPHAA